MDRHWERARGGSSARAETGAAEVDRRGRQPVVHAPGGRQRAVLIGGHIDSVPTAAGSTAPNVVAGAEVLRRIAAEGTPPARFASSTGPTRRARGSAAASSARARPQARCLTTTSCASSRDRDGVQLPDALAAHGVDLDSASRRGGARLGVAYLELHIEQGPVLECLDLPLGVVLGTFGVERHRDHVARASGARRLDADGQAPRRARRRGEARARDPRDRKARPAGRRLHLGRVVCEPGDRDLGRRDRRAASRSARPERAAACGDAQRGEGGERAVRRRGVDRRRLGAHLVDRADPLRRDADRLRRGRDPGGRRPVTVFPPDRSTTQRRSRARASRQ